MPVHVDPHARVHGHGGEPLDVGQAGRRAQRYLPRPGSGPAPGPARRSPVIIRRSPDSVSRLVASMAARASRAWSGRASNTLRPEPAWIAMMPMLCHDVVQLAGDPQPLRHRGLGRGLGPDQFGPAPCLPD